MNDERAVRREARPRGYEPLILGLALLSFGVIEWLDHLGRIDASDYTRWWPLVLVAIGIAHAVRGQWRGALIWTVLGFWFLLPEFHLGVLLGLWPLLIAAGGVTLILQALRPMRKDVATSGAFRAFAWMGGSARKVASNDFAGGDAIVVMGGCEVNLAKSTLTRDAVIDVLAFWGGIEIHVPNDWIIESHVTPILGGFSNRATNPTEGEGPRLILRGSAIMGGIEIRNPKETAA
jgi:hypothetical protein